jgi:hypothetical protein
MKKFALALLVLALTVPAMGAVNITMTAGSGVDCNKVTVSYGCTASEEVRAFALRITVSNKKFAVGSPAAISTDYYIYPGSIQFAVAGSGETYISNLGTPVAVQDANGGVIEMASLYAAGDVNHPSAPPTSGNLLSFRVAANTSQTVSLALDTQRGGVVLKDPNVTPTVNLPSTPLTVCGGGNACWVCPTQTFGDATGLTTGSPPDGKVNVYDLSALRKAYGTNSATSPHGKALGQYNCCADFCGLAAGSPPDGKVNVYDLARLRKNYGKTVGTACADGSCL